MIAWSFVAVKELGSEASREERGAAMENARKAIKRSRNLDMLVDV